MTTPLAGVDLMPTLLDLANETPPEKIDGRSVANAILNGRQPEPQPIFAEIASQEVIYWGSKEREQFAAHVMNLDGRWKYIRNRFDIDELYDLETDSDEMQNLALLPVYQPRITAMRQQIAEMICHTGPGPYDIFYGGSDGETWRIGHVRTRDFRTFEPNPHNPIFSPSPDPDAWDCDGLLTPQVIEVDNRYYMVYAGMRGGVSGRRELR